jgi:hypothetical protein
MIFHLNLKVIGHISSLFGQEILKQDSRAKIHQALVLLFSLLTVFLIGILAVTAKNSRVLMLVNQVPVVQTSTKIAHLIFFCNTKN